MWDFSLKLHIFSNAILNSIKDHQLKTFYLYHLVFLV